MQPLTHAQQNRLIVDSMPLVEPIAATFSGQKGIPFDDLVASGREGLVKAARSWAQKDKFTKWAYRCIEQQLLNFIRDWEPVETAGLINAEGEERFYEWSLYRTPYETWEKHAASPEELHIRLEELSHTINALWASFIGLSKRERDILEARFLREPRQTLESIARHHKISYARTVFIVDRALKKLKKVLRARGLVAAPAQGISTKFARSSKKAKTPFQRNMTI